MVRRAGLIAGLGVAVVVAAVGWFWMTGQDGNSGAQEGQGEIQRPLVELLPGHSDTPSDTVSATAVDLAALTLADLTPLRATVVGRAAPVRTPAEGAPHAVRHQWPALYASARFSGDALLLAFDDAVNRYRVTLDGGPGNGNATALIITRPGKSVVQVAGLGPGPHDVRLDKISEAVS
ncbi:MAG: hypothetical protein AAGF49_07645 [Pseudomonadota bacterium]